MPKESFLRLSIVSDPNALNSSLPSDMSYDPKTESSSDVSVSHFSRIPNLSPGSHTDHAIRDGVFTLAGIFFSQLLTA